MSAENPADGPVYERPKWYVAVALIVMALIPVILAVSLAGAVFAKNGRDLAKTRSDTAQVLAVSRKLDVLLSTFAEQNRLHREDNHTENACALQLLAEIARTVNRRVATPRLTTDFCAALIVEAGPPGLTTTTTTTTMLPRPRARKATSTSSSSNPSSTTTTTRPSSPTSTTAPCPTVPVAGVCQPTN